jgi:hypothetical protein
MPSRNICERNGKCGSNKSSYKLGMGNCSGCAIFYREGATHRYCLEDRSSMVTANLLFNHRFIIT